MGNFGAQGGRWEREICDKAELQGVSADRLTKRRIKGEPDVWVGRPPRDSEEANRAIKVVFWKRLVKSEGKSRRVADGEKDVAVLNVDDFLFLYWRAFGSDPQPEPLLIQAKARENLNVTRTLAGLRSGAIEYFKTKEER